MKEALLYQKTNNNNVRCNLCAHRCIINPGKAGICMVRENIDGILYTKVYGRTITQHIDPENWLAVPVSAGEKNYITEK